MAKKNVEPLKPYSGFILTFEPERTQWLAERLHSGEKLTESFSSLDWKFEPRELVILVLSKEPMSVSALALMERMHGSGGSGKLKMRMYESVVFDEPVADHELLVNELGSKVCTPETLKRADSTTWNALLDKLRQLRPAYANSIDHLISLREAERRLLGESNRMERLNEQRDGLGLTLDMARLGKLFEMSG